MPPCFVGVVGQGWMGREAPTPTGFPSFQIHLPAGERKAYFHPPPSPRQCMMGLLSEYHHHPQCIGKAYFSNLHPRLFPPISVTYIYAGAYMGIKKEIQLRRHQRSQRCFVRPHFGCQSLWPDWGKGLASWGAGWALATSRRSHQQQARSPARPPHAPFCGQSLPCLPPPCCMPSKIRIQTETLSSIDDNLPSRSDQIA